MMNAIGRREVRVMMNLRVVRNVMRWLSAEKMRNIRNFEQNRNEIEEKWKRDKVMNVEGMRMMNRRQR
jgi:hypothetical protein